MRQLLDSLADTSSIGPPKYTTLIGLLSLTFSPRIFLFFPNLHNIFQNASGVTFRASYDVLEAHSGPSYRSKFIKLLRLDNFTVLKGTAILI